MNKMHNTTWHLEATKQTLSEILDALEDRELYDELRVKCSLPATAMANLRLKALNKGVHLGFNKVPGGFFIYKKDKDDKGLRGCRPQNKDRAETIYKMYMDGNTLQKIGSKYDLTRERIRQIINSHELHNTLEHEDTLWTRKLNFVEGYSPSERSAAVDNFAKPFLLAVSDEKKCIGCAKVVGEKNRRCMGLCSECRQVVKTRLDAVSRMREYKNTGDRHQLAEAMVRIKKYNIQPDELRNM